MKKTKNMLLIDRGVRAEGGEQEISQSQRGGERVSGGGKNPPIHFSHFESISQSTLNEHEFYLSGTGYSLFCFFAGWEDKGKGWGMNKIAGGFAKKKGGRG